MCCTFVSDIAADCCICVADVAAVIRCSAAVISLLFSAAIGRKARDLNVIGEWIEIALSLGPAKLLEQGSSILGHAPNSSSPGLTRGSTGFFRGWPGQARP